ncbi:hypothetical protein CJ030_MR0G009068 [Morella rubra]|uniref:Uncharacterized protein n=1 Tax=Morella rubra TaxID=262757 RepID=A0A6A1UI56_9ROSI|nr:hypothetical protein CJ030_MR0G009068 [Morella rubra]
MNKLVHDCVEGESLAHPSPLPVTAEKRCRRRTFLRIRNSLAILPRPSTSNKLSRTNQGVDCAVLVLLVDGYNVCGYWMKLKKYFMNGRLNVARQKLIDELVTFSMLRDGECEAVTVDKHLEDEDDGYCSLDGVRSFGSLKGAWSNLVNIQRGQVF